MIFIRGPFIKIMIMGILLVGYASVSWSATDTSAVPSSDSVNTYLNNANKALEKQDRDAAITELMKAIKEQQALLEQMKNTPPPSPPPATTSQPAENNDTFLKQLTRALPLIGGNYGDAEDQWRKAYKLQHKAIFDLSRKDALPVFEQAIKEYRVVVEKYPANKRAP